MNDKAISPLRQRMIEDMTARHFAEKVQTDYIPSRTLWSSSAVRPIPRPAKTFVYINCT